MNANILVCEACGAPMPKPPKASYSQWQRRRFCNTACKAAVRPSITADYEINEDGCWVWQGAIDRNGYGKAYDPSAPPRRRVDWAHRVSYRIHVGPIPEKHEIDHTCENTVCVNPEHLDAVTKPEHARRTMQRIGKDEIHTRAAVLRGLNLTYGEIAEALGMTSRTGAQDAVNAAIRKGLVSPDDIPEVHRLDEEDRIDIVALYTLGISQRDIAAWYGIDSSQISRICNGKTSGHDAGTTPAERVEMRKGRVA